MFNRIARRYDLLNHVLSSGIDVLWRKRAIKVLQARRPQEILDIATGTGDLAFEAATTLKPKKVVGIDVAGEMLTIAGGKSRKKGLEGIVTFLEGAAEALPFESSSFDAVVSAFGVRNFSDLEQGLRECFRVLRPGGSAVILEFSNPRTFPVRQIYRFYSRSLLPEIGGWLSKDRKAYEYLPGTISEFPDGADFLSLLESAGFRSATQQRLTFGIATIYDGIKPSDPRSTYDAHR